MNTTLHASVQAAPRSARIGIRADGIAVIALLVAAVWVAVAGATSDPASLVDISGLGYWMAGLLTVAAVGTGLLATSAVKLLKENASLAGVAAWFGVALAVSLFIVPFLA